MSDGYRRAPPRAPEPKKPDEPELDAAAFARRKAKRDAVEDRGRLARVEIANRQLRIGAALALLLGIGLFALGAPMIGSGFHSRSLLRGLVLGPSLVGWAVFTLVTGTGGAEELKTAPTWVRVGQVVAPFVGALVGLALAFS